MTSEHEPGGAPVTALRGPSRGPSAGLALLVVVGVIAAAIAVALVSGPGPAPSSIALVNPSASTAVKRHPVATLPVPVIAPAPAATGTVLVLRDVADPPGELAALTRCQRSVRTTGHQLLPAVHAAEVDAVAEAVGRVGGGWLFVPPGIQAATRVWLGDDVVALAQAVGETVVAVGTKGEVWLGGPAGATRWIPVATPHGRTAWVRGADEVVGAGRCGPWTVPSGVARLRSLTCAGVDASTCLDLLPLLNADTSGLLQPGGDLLVAVPPCTDSHRCFATPLTFIGTPAGWSGPLGEVRAVEADDYSGTLRPLDAGSLPDYALDALSRPSLPLPTGSEKAERNTCADSLTGELQGSPWDPRVAWVGDTAVVWPTGTVLRFLPLARLTTPGRPGGAFAAQHDWVTLTGMTGSAGRSFDACAMAPTWPMAAPLGGARLTSLLSVGR